MQSLQSTTIESYFSFNLLMAKVCVIANLIFLLTKNDIIVHYNKIAKKSLCFSVVLQAVLTPASPSQNCKKISVFFGCLAGCLGTSFRLFTL